MAKKEDFIQGFKIIFRHLAQYKKDLIILSVLGVVSAVANGVVPYISGRLFDAIISPSKIFVGAKFEMPMFLLLLGLWLMIKLTADIVDWRIKSNVIENIAWADYFSRGYSHLLDLPISFHKSNKMGDVMHKIQRAASQLTVIIGNVVINLVPQFLSIIIAFIICFYINYKLTFILVIGVMVYVITMIKLVSPVAKIQRQMHKFEGEAFGDSYDAVLNVQSIKQAVAESYEQKKIFNDFKRKIIEWWIKIESIWSGLSFYQRILITFTQFVVFIFSIFFIFKGQMTIGQLIMFNGYAAMIFGPFVVLGNNWQTIQNGVSGIQQAQKILDEPTEIYTPENAVVLPDIKGEVEYQNVSFYYEKKQGDVLKDISFKVESGEIVALVGESGVGKSTLVDLISGYYFAQKGKVLIDGHNTKNLDLKFLRSQIAVVPQEIILFNDTIKKNIVYGSFGVSEKKMKEAAEKSNSAEFIENFSKKYNQKVGERGVKLSVGQKQRVAIARAILRDPRILILDEPTSALDAKSEKFITESLEELMKGRTTLIIAHRLSTVRKADKILVVKEGKIAEIGRHDDLIKIPNGVYRELYELQKL